MRRENLFLVAEFFRWSKPGRRRPAGLVRMRVRASPSTGPSPDPRDRKANEHGRPRQKKSVQAF